MMNKTTIAIGRNYRERLGKIKRVLEARNGKFIDMDDVVGYLVDNLPSDMDSELNRRV